MGNNDKLLEGRLGLFRLDVLLEVVHQRAPQGIAGLQLLVRFLKAFVVKGYNGLISRAGESKGGRRSCSFAGSLGAFPTNE